MGQYIYVRRSNTRACTVQSGCGSRVDPLLVRIERHLRTNWGAGIVQGGDSAFCDTKESWLQRTESYDGDIPEQQVLGEKKRGIPEMGLGRRESVRYTQYVHCIVCCLDCRGLGDDLLTIVEICNA